MHGRNIIIISYSSISFDVGHIISWWAWESVSDVLCIDGGLLLMALTSQNTPLTIYLNEPKFPILSVGQCVFTPSWYGVLASSDCACVYKGITLSLVGFCIAKSDFYALQLQSLPLHRFLSSGRMSVPDVYIVFPNNETASFITL